MRIYLNEKPIEIDAPATTFTLCQAFKPLADVVVLNSFIVKEEMDLKEDDRVTLIERGEMPSQEDLEALMVSRHTVGVHQKVKNATVAIAGLGGLGSTCAVSLARMGVGKLILVDFDVVEPSNLNRQQYFIRHIGMDKTQALRGLLADINPFIEVVTETALVTEANVSSLFGQADILVEAFDNPVAKAMLLSTWLQEQAGKPIVTGSGMAGSYSSNTVVTRKVMKNAYVVGDGHQEARQGCGLMAPRVGVAANHQANMVLRLILGESDV